MTCAIVIVSLRIALATLSVRRAGMPDRRNPQVARGGQCSMVAGPRALATIERRLLSELGRNADAIVVNAGLTGAYTLIFDALIFRGMTDLTVPDQPNTVIYAMRSRLGDAGNAQRGTFTAGLLTSLAPSTA